MANFAHFYIIFILQTASIERLFVRKLHFSSYIICFVKGVYCGNVDTKRLDIPP
jgi:hypothetical protein